MPLFLIKSPAAQDAAGDLFELPLAPSANDIAAMGLSLDTDYSIAEVALSPFATLNVATLPPPPSGITPTLIASPNVGIPTDTGSTTMDLSSVGAGGQLLTLVGNTGTNNGGRASTANINGNVGILTEIANSYAWVDTSSTGALLGVLGAAEAVAGATFEPRGTPTGTVRIAAYRMSGAFTVADVQAVSTQADPQVTVNVPAGGAVLSVLSTNNSPTAAFLTATGGVNEDARHIVASTRVQLFGSIGNLAANPAYVVAANSNGDINCSLLAIALAPAA